ncbi:MULTISPECIES: energy transducer TonB [unclassified Variovorax]|uniref:energy transducer TonB n=1 Tax=unclassified Variovorax TaxID=663243 RepID=UPI000B875648|nr:MULTISPECIES: energy transducer TonB [unclassified Variovorax]
MFGKPVPKVYVEASALFREISEEISKEKYREFPFIARFNCSPRQPGPSYFKPASCRKSLAKMTSTSSVGGGAAQHSVAVGQALFAQKIRPTTHRLQSLWVLLACCTLSACSAISTTPPELSPVTVATAPPAVNLRPTDLQGWAAKVAAAVRSNVVFPDADMVVGNPGAQFDVRTGADGKIYSVVLLHGSGLPDWDQAALRALLRTERLPPDNDYMPPRVVITLRPKR